MPKPRTVEEYKERQAMAERLREQSRQLIRQWIAATFEPGSVTLTPETMPGLPGATWVQDANGDKLLGWYDIFADQIRWR